MKICKACGENKPLNEYAKRAKSIDGLQYSCKTCRNAYNKKHQEKNAEHLREYRRKNRHLFWLACSVASKKRKLRVPKWLTKEDKEQMKQIYKQRDEYNEKYDEVYEVDHVLPLLGKLVSGLHVPANLQVITKTANRTKSAKFSLK